MFRVSLAWACVAWASLGPLYAAQQQSSASPERAGSQYRAVLNRYCVTCHNEKLRTGELTLDKIDVENPAADAEIWEKVIRKLRTGAMPPTRAPRPDAATYDSFAAYLETAIDRAAVVKPNPGRPVIHRLNRAEYANAVRDLLGVTVDSESLLPADDSGYGFDNVGAVLTVSPTLLERYLAAARKISRLAVGDPGVRPSVANYEVPKLLLQSDRMDERLPFGSRGGTALTHDFPADGEYTFRIRLLRDGGNGGYIRGVALRRQLDLRMDGARLKLFTVGGEQKGKVGNGFSPEYLGDPAQEEYERGGADAGLEIRVPVKAGPHEIGVAFLLEQTSKGEGVPARRAGRQCRYPGRKKRRTVGGKCGDRWTLRRKGLGESPSRRKIFVSIQRHGRRYAVREGCRRWSRKMPARRRFSRRWLAGRIAGRSTKPTSSLCSTSIEPRGGNLTLKTESGWRFRECW